MAWQGMKYEIHVLVLNNYIMQKTFTAFDIPFDSIKFLLSGVKAEQTFNTLSARIKESKPEDPELEAIKTSQLIKHEKENDFDERKKAKCVS